MSNVLASVSNGQQLNQGSNSDPTGAVEIVGRSEVGASLSADTTTVLDADGLGTFAYLWFRDGALLAGETSDSYLLTQDDAGAHIHVEVSYTDGEGFDEVLSSQDVAILQSQAGAADLDATQNDLLGALVSESVWNTQAITYAFYEVGAQYDTTPSFGADGVSDGWTSDDKSAVRAVFSDLSTFTAVTFVEGQSTATVNIALAQDILSSNVAGYAFLPAPPDTSNVVFDTAEMDREDYVTSQLIAHELGHALGLEHPFEGITFPGVPDGASQAPGDFALNQIIFTAQSYTVNLETPGIPDTEFFPNAYGYGALDIAALQAIYGTNENHSVGTNVYETPTEHQAIWDAGGADTFDFSSSTEDAVIDLRAATLNVEEGGGGFVSYIKTPATSGGTALYEPDGLYTIAYGVVIEDAVGGSGNDIIVGNDAANDLNGLQGDDSILGGAGDDDLHGGDGAPLDGIVMFSTEFANQSGQANITGVPAFATAFTLDFFLTIDPTDTQRHGVVSMQPDVGDGTFLQLLVLDDSFILQVGTGAFEYTTYTTGILRSDLNDGAAHRITMTADKGTGQVAFYLDGVQKFTVDVPALDLSNATAFPGTIVLGNADAAFDNSYTMNGSIGDVAIYSDGLSAQAIADRGTTQRSDPTDANILHLWRSDGSLTTLPNVVGDPDGTLTGVQFVNNLSISSDNDTLRGEDGNDTLTGGVGDDVLDGGDGLDFFVTGVDQDTITTGNGQDVVQVQDVGDRTVVTDFTIGEDKLDLTGFAVQAVLDAINDMATGTAELIFDSGTTILLEGVSNTAFSVTDVILNQPNAAPTGAVTLTGTPTQNETLTADTSGVEDADGINTQTAVIQWTRDGTAIDGAQGATYVLTQADVGRDIGATYSYVDAFGTAETVSSTTVNVANADDPLEGAPVILGNARLGQTLTVDTSAISDPDQIDPESFAYQWVRDGQPIAGATSVTYVIVAEDLGAALSVQIEVGDQGGGVGTATSAATAAVTDNTAATGQPVITGQTLVGETLTVNVAGVSDADGFEPAAALIEWRANGQAIAGANADQYVLTENEAGAEITVAYSFTDLLGGDEEIISDPTAQITALNSQASGRVGINATAELGTILVADLGPITDANGINAATIVYEWTRQRDGEDDPSPIQNATNSTYQVTEDDVGATLAVTVSYTDNDGYAESVSSDGVTVNTPVSGAVIISGSVQNDAILTVDLSQIVDPDGFDPTTIAYQWSRNGLDLADPIGTGASYEVTSADFGADLRVEISYTDTLGREETLISAPAAQGDQRDLVVFANELFDDTLDRGQLARFGLTIGNLGNTAVNSTQTELYLSTDAIINPDEDILLTRTTLSGVQPGRSVEQMSQGHIPLTLAAGETYYIGAIIDALDTEDETNELNNRSAVFEFTVNDEAGETISGTTADDAIQGTGGADTIAGRRGNDTITPGSGDDTVDGGIGTADVLMLDGAQSNYTLVISDGPKTLTDRRENGEGTDTIDRIEYLDFDEELPIFGGSPMHLDAFDGPTDLSADAFEEIIELYIAYFNRAPDAIGVAYWATQYAEGLSLQHMAESFFDQAETRETYAGVVSAAGELVDPDAFVTAVYDNVLGRAPDQAGFNFWTNVLANSPDVTPGTFILEIIKGAKLGASSSAQSAADRDFLANKTDIGTFFAVIRGMSDVEEAAQVMSFFDGTEASIGLAVAAAEGHFQEASSAENGDFLMPIIGVLDNPFL